MTPLSRIKLMANGIVIAAMFIGLAVFIRILGPIHEGRYLPVTTDVTVELLKTESDRMLFQAWGNKRRDCKLVEARVLVDVKGDGVQTKGVIYVVDDGVGARERPLGMQDLGVWAIHPKSKAIYVQTWYQCHPFWNTYQQLGNWPAADIANKGSPE